MRFVITSGHPNLHGTIGEWQRYDAVGVVLEFKDEKGFVSECSFPLDTVRELDDTPILAGDEVVCVAVEPCGYVINHVRGELTVGSTYKVLRPAKHEREQVEIINDKGDLRQYDHERFVKVKPQSAPEVKQEAAEQKPVEDPEPNFDYQPSPPPTKRELGTCLTRVGREFWMVKGFGPTQYEHDSLDSAMIEAERLARANPGVPFTVLGPVSILFNGVARIDRNFDDGMPF